MIGARPRRARIALAIAFFSAIFAIAACDAFLGLGDDKALRSEPDASDAAPEAAHDASDASSADSAAPDALTASCLDLGVPLPPARDDDGGADRSFFVAFENLDFGDHASLNSNAAGGLNLDHACTCPMPESCTPRTPNTKHCDLEAGVDNAANSLLLFYSAIAMPLDDLVNAQIAQGAFTVLLRIAKYNGLANDTDVELSFFTSSGTPVDDAGAHASPVYDGGGSWDIDPSSTYGGTGADAIAKYNAVNAYVTNHVLVADMGNFPISFGGGGTGLNVGLQLDMKLSGVFITGALTDDGAGGFTVSAGVLGGRWSTRSIILAIGSLPSQLTSGQKICEDTATFAKLRDLVCSNADIAFDRGHDSTQPPWPCSAVSIGIKFAGVPAKIEGFGAAADSGTPCESLLDPQLADCP